MTRRLITEIGSAKVITPVASDQIAVRDISTGELGQVTLSAVDFGTRQLTVIMDDISTAGSAFTVSPYAGTISKIQSVIDGAIITADAGITTEIGGAAITSGAITIANSGSAAGTVDSATPTAANTLAVGDALEVITDGASANTVRGTFIFTISLT